MVKIRKAGINDEDKVMDLYMQLGNRQSTPGEDSERQEKIRPIFRELVTDDDKGTIIIADRENDIIGMISLSYATSMGSYGIYSCIHGLIVNEKARGERVGSKLLETAIATSESKGCFYIELGGPSEEGYLLYSHYGFKDIGKHLRKHL